MDLGPDAVLPELGRQRNGGGQVVGHGQDQYVGGSSGQVGIQHPLLAQDVEQPGQADGNAHAGELLVGVVFRQVVVSAAGAHGADLRVVQQGGLVDGAGVVVQAPGDGQVHSKILGGHAEGRQILHHGVQLREALVEHLVPVLIALQCRQHFLVGAGDGDEFQNLAGLLLRKGNFLVHEDGFHLLRADLVQLVHGTHNVAGLLRQAQHGVKAVEDLPVVHPDLEPLEAQGGEGLVDNGGNLRLVDDGQLAVADDVDVRLIELPEPAPLSPLAAVHLADLIPAEGEGQVIVVQGHVLGQRHRQVKPQGQVGVALLEAVDLLFGFAAALCQQHVAGLNDGGVQGGEAVQGVGAAQHLHDALHLLLRRGEEFHKAGQCPGGHFSHGRSPFIGKFKKECSRPKTIGTRAKNSLRGATQIQGPKDLLWPPGTGREPWTFPPPLRRCPSFSPNGALSAARPSLEIGV